MKSGIRASITAMAILMGFALAGGVYLAQSAEPAFAASGDTQVVHITKRNAQGFAIDGDSGAENRQNVYMWSQNEDNVNQQWIEIDLGNGFFQYQKAGTNHCIDGNHGGANRQNVYLWTCGANNQNQHWEKVDVGNGFVQLVKRNASGFALDGGNGGARAQNIGLYDSSNPSQNLHWQISVVGETAPTPTTTPPTTTPPTTTPPTTTPPTTTPPTTTPPTTTPPTTTPEGALHPDVVKIVEVEGRNPGRGWGDSYSSNGVCYMDTTFDHDIGDVVVDTPDGQMTIRELFDRLPEGPGANGNPAYNDIQCGNGPANSAIDETQCPGLVDYGREGCGQLGPMWDLSSLG